jgi:hypothetical protein
LHTNFIFNFNGFNERLKRGQTADGHYMNTVVQKAKNVLVKTQSALETLDLADAISQNFAEISGAFRSSVSPVPRR